MTCHELERLSLEEAPVGTQKAHRASCPDCERLGADVDAALELSSGMTAPPLTASLREALYAIPRMTVACSRAPELMALAAEVELSPEDAARLRTHLARCEGCGEAAAALKVLPELLPAAPAPWLLGRIAATRPPRRSSGWRKLLNPRAVVAYAYAAAVVVMVAGLNPADLARRAGVGLEANTRVAVAAADSSLADRFGNLQEEVIRRFAVLKGRAGGYGRAALSTALALVMREETPPPGRPRSGQGRIPRDNQTQMMAWRA